MLLLEDKRKYKNMQEFKEMLDAEEVFYSIMGIKEFNNRSRLWMKKVCKHYIRKGCGYQGFTHTNWDAIALAKRR